MAAHLSWEVVGTHAEPENPVQPAIADGDCTQDAAWLPIVPWHEKWSNCSFWMNSRTSAPFPECQIGAGHIVLVAISNDMSGNVL